MHPVRRYFSELLRHWMALMSCAAFTALAFYVATLPDQSKSNVVFVRGCGVLAIFFLLVAGYRAWKRQYDLYQTELAKNELPEIRGDFFGELYR